MSSVCIRYSSAILQKGDIFKQIHAAFMSTSTTMPACHRVFLQIITGNSSALILLLNIVLTTSTLSGGATRMRGEKYKPCLVTNALARLTSQTKLSTFLQSRTRWKPSAVFTVVGMSPCIHFILHHCII
jgi:hypothetical protein